MDNKHKDGHRIGYHKEYYKTKREEHLYKMKNDKDYAIQYRAKQMVYYNKKKLEDPNYLHHHAELAKKSIKKRKLDPNFKSGHQKKREQVYDVLGHKCIICGFSDKRALQIDHIFNNGLSEYRILGSSYAICKKIVEMGDEAKTEYQILCANCNWIKRKPYHCINNKRHIKCL